MRKQFGILIICVCAFVQLNAQNIKYKQGVKVPCPVCYASGKTERARIPPPKEFLLKSAESAKAEIIVDYVDFSEEAQVAFQYAVDIWESIIESEVPIRMEAIWSSTLDQNVLGSCGPETYYSNFKNAPFNDRYYPVAIAEKISKEELNGESRYDVVANFNNKIDWYYGTDLETPDDKYDFVSVVLHEIGHGLGFTGFFFVEDDLGGYGFFEMGDATSFDLLVESATNKQLVDASFYDNVSTGLKRALEGYVMYANSPVAKVKNEGLSPRLYAPGEFDDGSSVYHLNDMNYPHGNENSLMTHAVGKGEAVHDPGPLTRGIMDDIGWRNLFIHFNPPKDKEELQPINFNVLIESDYEIDTSALFIIYSFDDFNSQSDSLNLIYSNEISAFTASLNPELGVDSITYYVQVADTMNRVRTSPAIAPKKYHKLKFGPDSEVPLINHDPIPYYLMTAEPLTVTVEADDNFGVDTVYVEFSVNGVQQAPFGLTQIDNNKYIGTFSVNDESLNDGDKIEYIIFATDSSSAKNSAQLPLGADKFSFQIEEIFDPVHTYSNDFNSTTSDFLIYDFEIYTDQDFENDALHSAHPYLSPNSDNNDLNFSTLLKHPIVLRDSGTMFYDEIVLVEPSEAGAVYGDEDFWDYVIVEGSKDFGESWMNISSGYDAGSYAVWEDNYNASIVENISTATGTSEWFMNREINLLENGNFAVGDTILIRFRLYSDPYASGWGWVIDNLRIQPVVSAGIINISSANVKVYPNPFKHEIKVFIGSLTEITDVQLDIFDMFGKKVFTESKRDVFGEFEESINIGELRNGIYLMNVSGNGKHLSSKKLIKN